MKFTLLECMAESLKHKTKVGLIWSFLNQFTNHGMQFAIGIFMARKLSPSDYGLTALPAVLLSIAGIFIEGHFGDALVRKNEVKEKDLSTAFLYTQVVGLFFYIIVFFASPFLADFYDTPILTPMMRVTSLSFLYGAIGVPMTVILRRRLDFKTPFKVSIVCRLVSGIVGLTLAYTGYGVWALVLSSLASSIVDLILTWSFVRWIPKTGWSKESFSYLWNYGNKMIASVLIDRIYNSISPAIIMKFYNSSSLGMYNRAFSYASLPSMQITSTIQTVSFPVISKMKNDDTKLRFEYRRMLRLSAFVVFPLMVMLCVLSRPLIITMITAKWASCVPYLQILCFSLMWFPINALNLNLLRAKGRSDLFLRLEIVKKTLGVIILIFTLPRGLIAFCWGSVLSSILSILVNTYYTGKLINYGFFRQMMDILPMFLLSLVTGLVVYLMNIHITSLWLQIILGGIIGLSFYVIVAKLFKFKELDDARYMLAIK